MLMQKTSLSASQERSTSTSPQTTSRSLTNFSGKKATNQKFSIHKTKARIYKERSKLKNVKVSDIFPQYCPGGESLNGIYINENLTPFRRDLVSKALRKRKNKILTSVWSLDSKVFVKTSPDADPIRIETEADLNGINTNM